MTWQTELTTIVRVLIDDIDGATYTDQRLQNTILVGAQLIVNEVDFDQTYTIDIPNSGLSPDPTNSPRDDAFINLTSIKTACIILKSEAKIAAASAVSVKDGPSSIDMTGSHKAKKEVADDMCGAYKHALAQYQLGNARPGQMVIGPITVENILPQRGNFS